MKLSKMSSLKPSAIHVKTRFDQAPVESFSDDDSSEQSQIEFSGTSPNYLKPTSFSDAKKASSQASSNNSESLIETTQLKMIQILRNQTLFLLHM